MNAVGIFLLVSHAMFVASSFFKGNLKFRRKKSWNLQILLSICSLSVSTGLNQYAFILMFLVMLPTCLGCTLHGIIQLVLFEMLTSVVAFC